MGSGEREREKKSEETAAWDATVLTEICGECPPPIGVYAEEDNSGIGVLVFSEKGMAGRLNGEVAGACRTWSSRRWIEFALWTDHGTRRRWTRGPRLEARSNLATIG